MKAVFSIVSLVVVLCIVTITVQRQLRASGLAPAGAGASGPYGVASQPTPAEYERELHRAIDAGMAIRASQAESTEGNH